MAKQLARPGGALAAAEPSSSSWPAAGHVGLAAPSTPLGHPAPPAEPLPPPPLHAGLLRALASDPPRLQLLEHQLEQLAPQLSSVAALLRTTVLPLVPWLSTEAADRVQVCVCVCAGGW